MDAAPPYLSRFQRTVVRHLMQGLTVKETAAEMKTARPCVVDSLVIIRRKLDAATTAQAVLKAYVLGCTGPGIDCGTRHGYVRHLERNEDADPACRYANQLWLKAQDAPQPRVRPLTEAQVRIIRAFHCGRSHADLMQAWGVSRNQLHRAVTDMYDRLGVKDVPREERRERALEAARERGLLRAERPSALPPVRGATVELTAREREILRAVDGSMPLSEAAPVLGMPVTSLSSRLTEIYRKLDVAHLPRKSKRASALRVARARGYLA